MKILIALLVLCVCAPGATFHLIVAGLGGEPEYESRFTSLAREMDKLVRSPETTVETLTGPGATKAALTAAFSRIAASAQPADLLVLTLIGHGTFDGRTYRFNLPGPDFTAEELRSWLDRVPARQLIVNASSSSGACTATLRRENRVIVTATKSGTEKNATVFARYWMEALRDGAADSDKNDSLSAEEAFRFAQARTARFYETQKRLATEHAQLEDGSHVASQWSVVRYGEAQNALRDPAKRELFSRKEELEQAIDKLKFEKAAMPSADYRTRLRVLLLELARIQEQLDK